ncbi:sugar ABC transporter substrate-binding protein [Paenibacillus oralis]|uniref:Sugar ABC transporter substrate-binding protein n=1 Tax=Paenibacillus oralis TaxID=2490856 RepID=A0A3P3U421_9BACL|nr:sugar ABC transporter substrate-binding protein [Paenibacillus oralis]RRJ64900.1 sugar ABC transporter substrate-binding protein [Paenibacillus oralis]
MLKRKWTRFIAASAILALIVSGCASGSGADPDQGAGSNGGTPDNGTVTIKLHTWYPKKTDNWDVAIAEFEKKYPNIKVEFVSAEDNNSNEYYKKLDLAAASGEDLDVMMFSNMNYLSQRMELGMLEPIDGYLEKEGAVLADEYTVDTRIAGKTYGLPGKSVLPMVFINENHLKEAGLELPKDWTWDEYMQYAKAMTKTDGGKTRYGTYFHSWATQAYFIQNMNQAAGANLTTDDGTKANVDTPNVRKSLELRLQGEKEGVVTPYAEVVSQKLNYRPQYFNQETSMITMGSFLVPEAGGTEQVPATFKTVFAPLPKVNKEDPISGNVSGDVLGIYSKSKHKEEAYTFIRWFTTEGITLQGKYFPSWKKANMNEVVDHIIAGTKTPEMIDKDSLLYVLENTKQTTAAVAVPFHAELEKVFVEEFDAMMLSAQDLDTTVKNAQERIQKIIDSK